MGLGLMFFIFWLDFLDFVESYDREFFVFCLVFVGFVYDRDKRCRGVFLEILF